MNNNMKRVYSETYAILQTLHEEFLNKVPKNLIKFLESNKDGTYNPNIHPNIPLENQNLLPETISLLTMLKLDYWCKDEEEKKELLEILNKNEKEYQDNLKIQYNPENLFNKQKKSNIKEVEKNQQSIEYKESLFKKALKKFLILLNKSENKESIVP